MLYNTVRLSRFKKMLSVLLLIKVERCVLEHFLQIKTVKSGQPTANQSLKSQNDEKQQKLKDSQPSSERKPVCAI